MTKSSSNQQEVVAEEKTTPISEKTSKTIESNAKASKAVKSATAKPTTTKKEKPSIVAKKEKPAVASEIDFKAEIAKYQKQIEKQSQVIAQLEEELKNAEADKGLKKLEKKLDAVLSLLEKKEKTKKKKK